MSKHLALIQYDQITTMDERIQEIYDKIKDLEETFRGKRDSALSPLRETGMNWTKLRTTSKLKKADAVDFLCHHDQLMHSLLEGVAKVKKELFNVMNPGTTEEETAVEEAPETKETAHEGEETEGNTPGDEQEEEEEETQPELSEVCPFYLRNRCRHGLSGTKMVDGKTCTKKHPPICRKFSSYGTTRRLGCTRGIDCKYFHRPLCKSSELKRECFNQNCRNHHLKHTRRFQAEEGWQTAGGPGRRTRFQSPKRQGQKQQQQEQGNRSSSTTRASNPSSQGTSRNNLGAKAGEDFYQRLLDQLTQAIPQMVAQEMSRQMQPKLQNNPFTWQLPAGCTMTRSPHA